MSTLNWKPEKDLCRCCHAEGSFHNLAEPQFNMGQEEVYSEMLRNSFNIDLSPVTGVLCSMMFTICDTCILRLRDSSNFKRQVLLCEERFKDMYQNVVKALDPEFEVKQEAGPLHEDIVKVEVQNMDEDEDEGGGDGFDMSFDDDDADDDKTVLQMKLEEAKKKGKAKATPKPKAKAPTPKAQTPKTQASKAHAPKTQAPKTQAPTPAKKTGRPKKADAQAESTVGAEDAADDEKPKKGAKRDRPKFVLKDTDYKEEGGEYTCAHCEKRYDKIFSLRFHVKTKHYKIPRFSCAYCKKEFMTPAPLTVHKLEEHNIDERFKCKACNAMFNTKIQLRKHINNFHMLGEKYKCEFCEYESFSFEGMYKHKFKHRTVKNYHCKFCRKSFLRKATLDLHERIHTGDRRKVCKECGQAFVQKASLNYHMTKYHPEVNF